MHRNRITSQSQKAPIEEHGNKRIQTRIRLRRGLLNVARGFWILFALCNLMSLPFGIQAFYTQTLVSGRSVPTVAHALTQLHFTAAQEALFLTIIYVLASMVFVVIGMVIFWRLWGTANELMGLFASFIFVTIGTTGISGVFTDFSGPTNPILQIALFISGSSFAVMWPCLGGFLLTFPNGRFAPRWSWLLILLWIVQFVFFMVVSQGISGDAAGFLLALVVFITWGSTVGMQVYRYVRVYIYSERQQTKWLIFGVTLGLLLNGVFVLIGYFFLGGVGSDSLYQQLVFNLGGLVLDLLIAFSIVIALLRYELWNIDFIINRTLVYGTLTGILALLYVGLVIGLQSVVHLITGQVFQSPIVIVASTLIIAALFQPLRHRIQAMIDRRFYRRKYDATKVVEVFSATLRNEVDLSTLREHLVAVVQETMQPAHVSLWLRQPSRREISLFQTSKTPTDFDYRTEKVKEVD
ncbi:MAG TPA: hypothetical protein VED37_03985 [Ktedonobacteraceae bacterium]|nr:hypothetical protein [Ktedonobacteraceae bacterium]